MSEGEVLMYMIVTAGSALFVVAVVTIVPLLVYTIIKDFIRPAIRAIGIDYIPLEYQHYFYIKRYEYYTKKLSCGVPHRDITCSFRRCKHTGHIQIWSINQAEWMSYTQLSINYLDKQLIYKET